MAIQFITNPYDQLTAEEQARKVCEGGIKWVQLRMKDCSDDEIVQVGRRVRAITKEYGATLILNDYPHLVKEIAADGVHLGKQDMHPSEAREMLGQNAIIGGTANTEDDVIRLLEIGVDYIGLGPFKFTSTKKNLSPVLGGAGIEAVVKKRELLRNNTPIVAIGGIGIENLGELVQTGVEGIAISSALLQADIAETTAAYVQQWSDLKDKKVLL